jgi:hypothetical protein
MACDHTASVVMSTLECSGLTHVIKMVTAIFKVNAMTSRR